MPYIAVDEHGIAIQGVGETEEEAVREAIEESGIMHSLGLTYEEAVEKFRVYEATPELVQRVLSHGGFISWEVVNRVATLPRE